MERKTDVRGREREGATGPLVPTRPHRLLHGLHSLGNLLPFSGVDQNIPQHQFWQ